VTPSSLAPFADQRILVGAPATITAKFRDQYGEPAARGTVTVSAVDAAGATVFGSTATTLATTVYSADISPITDLAFITATWADNTYSTQTTIEVVSGYYFSIADARAYKNGVMSDQTTYSDALIRSTRDEVEREFERVCWPFLPRYRRVTFEGWQGCRLALPDMHIRSIKSVVEYDSTGTLSYTWTADDLATLQFDASGAVESLGRWFGSTLGYLAIEYTYGFERPPADVLEAAFRRLRHKMNADKSGVPDRAINYTVAEGGSYSLSTPGRNGAVTGIPDVDAVLNDPRYRRPLVGVG
jgi:hypothetical protein